MPPTRSSSTESSSSDGERCHSPAAFDCNHVQVGSWTDERGREWIGACMTWDPRPDTGTTWVLLACCATSGELSERRIVLSKQAKTGLKGDGAHYISIGR